MKEAINQRFIDTVNYLLKKEKDLNKSKIASTIGIKPSTFSEILNKRMNIGLDSIILFCDKFSISVEWLLLGKEPMIKQEAVTNYVNEGSESYGINYKDLAESRKETIECLRKEISYLEEKLALTGNKRNAG